MNQEDLKNLLWNELASNLGLVVGIVEVLHEFYYGV